MVDWGNRNRMVMDLMLMLIVMVVVVVVASIVAVALAAELSSRGNFHSRGRRRSYIVLLYPPFPLLPNVFLLLTQSVLPLGTLALPAAAMSL